MRKTTTGLLSLALAAGLATTMSVPTAAASAANARAQKALGEPQAATPSDNLPDPIAEKQAELRKTAVSSVLQGEATPQQIGGSTVVKVGESERAATAAKGNKKAQKAKKVDQYVELAREDTDQLFVLVVQFGNERHPSYPDKDTNAGIPGPARFDGPLFNQIPEPDRAVDNSTDWHPNYGKAYYQDLYFGNGSVTGTESMRQYYEKQSSGRYSIAGMVTDPVTVPLQRGPLRHAVTASPAPATSAATRGTWSGTGWTAGSRSRRPPARPTPRSPRSSRSSTSGTATTSTATATSTSPTATSTTCRSCTPAATRPTVTPTRARTPSGRTAGAPSKTPNPTAPIPVVGGTPVGQHRHLGR